LHFPLGRNNLPSAVEILVDFWKMLTYGAWALSIGFFLWIIIDALKVHRNYDDDFLMSSTEGEE
jgi:hypothetical protein